MILYLKCFLEKETFVWNFARVLKDELFMFRLFKFDCAPAESIRNTYTYRFPCRLMYVCMVTHIEQEYGSTG